MTTTHDDGCVFCGKLSRYSSLTTDMVQISKAGINPAMAVRSEPDVHLDLWRYIQVWSFTPLNPVVPGHRLFVPRVHVVAADSKPEITGAVFEAAATHAAMVTSDFNLITSAGRSATQTVRHLHVHYVPREEGDGLTLPWTGQH